jgi:hypothetical protein
MHTFEMFGLNNKQSSIIAFLRLIQLLTGGVAALPAFAFSFMVFPSGRRHFTFNHSALYP